MSIKLMSQVWDGDDPELKDARLLTLLSLADHADDSGENCYPSIPRLAQRARVSERQISRVLIWLEEHGYIQIIAKGNGRGRKTEYRVSPKGDMMSTFDATKDDKLSALRPKKDDIGDIKDDIGDTKRMTLETPITPIFVDDPSFDPPIEPSIERAPVAPAKPADHPAVQIFREVWQRYPSKPQMPIIAQAVQDMDAWRDACQAWASAGYKPTNVTGMLDWYAHPEKYLTPHKSHANNYTTKAQALNDVFARTRERLERHGLVNGSGNHVQVLPERGGQRRTDRQLPAPPV